MSRGDGPDRSAERTAAEAASSRAVYVISVAAEIAGVHPQTLRIYERRGLLSPARTGGGSRRYSDADIAQLRRIQQLTDAGINLAGVQRILELEEELARTEREIERIREQHRAELDQVQRSHRRDLVPVSTDVTLYRRRRR